MTMPPGGTGGWEEPSPPSQRRNMPNYDDGTSLWGNPQPGNVPVEVREGCVVLVILNKGNW